MRNQDNYINSKQYIIDHLYPYSNSDNTSEDFNILKMKIWVIDGIIRKEEYINGETPDKDVSNPMDHWSDLQNDLIYLDKYIRTKDDKLIQDPPEMDYYQFKQQRIDNKERFINRINEDTEENYKDWEQPYNQRPTRLLDNDFEDLYNIFKVKESLGEWENAFDITKKVTEYVIDMESYQAEAAILTHQTPDDIYVILDENAEANALKNDYNYVVEMNKIYDEIWNIIKSVEPSIPELPEEDESSGEESEEEGGEDTTTWFNSQLVFINLPERRNQVGLSSNHFTHKGTVIVETGTGGYRFKYRKVSDGSGITLPLDDTKDFIMEGFTSKLGELERSFDDWLYAHYYEEETVTLEGTEVIIYLISLNINKDSLPSGSNNPGDLTLDRFNVLNERWKVINNLREFQIQNNGTRNIIESMLNAEIPDMLSDKESHFNDKKDQKEFYTNMLKERLGEFN